MEAVAIIQVRDGSDLSQDSKGGRDAITSDSGYILKVQPAGFGEGGQIWDVRERKE